MNIAVLGTGMVGQAIAGRLHELGHAVVVGTRDPQATLARTEPDGMGNPPFAAWHADHAGVALATFADAAARRRARRQRLDGRGRPRGARPGRRREPRRQGRCVDIANPLDFSAGLPAHPVRQGHRLAGRAGPARLPRSQGGQDASTPSPPR